MAKWLCAAVFGMIFLLAGAPTIANARDWSRSVVATPAGGYLIGNPKAPVKLIEYLSLTCPHCRHFNETGGPALKTGYVAKGQISYEIRNFVLNSADLAASLLMRCAPPVQAVKLMDGVFGDQEKLFAPIYTLTEEARQRVMAAPVNGRVAILAKESGIDRWFVAHGLKPTQAAACLASDKGQAQLVSMREEGVKKYAVDGTPSFSVNGAKVDGTSWEILEPAIKAALAAPKSGS